MFTAHKNFLPRQQRVIARRHCDAAMPEAFVLSPLRLARDGNSCAPANLSLNETVTIFGAAEFIDAGFRVHATGRR
jgi:hypothetical protein